MQCDVCGAAIPWTIAFRDVALRSAAAVVAVLAVVGGLMWWRSSDAVPVRPVDRVAFDGVIGAPPTDPPTSSPEPEPTSTRPPNSPFPPTETPLPPVIDYTVQSGDTAYAIAFKYGVTLDDILEANQDAFDDLNSLSIGDVLRIPLRDADAGVEQALAAEDAGAEIAEDADAGDDPGDVDAGAQTETEPSAEDGPTQVTAGTDPTGEPAARAGEAAAAPGEPIVVTEALTYNVQRGDTLGRIAAEYGVTVDELVERNDLSGPNALLRIGDPLTISSEVVITATPAPTEPSQPEVTRRALVEDGTGAGAGMGSDPTVDRSDAEVAAPIPLVPGNGAVRTGDAVTLRWVSAGVLPPGAFYVVEIGDADGPEDRAATDLAWIRNASTAYRVPARWRPALDDRRRIRWSVSVRRERDALLGAGPGIIISPPPTWRTFTWAPGGLDVPEPSTPPTRDGGSSGETDAEGTATP